MLRGPDTSFPITAASWDQASFTAPLVLSLVPPHSQRGSGSPHCDWLSALAHCVHDTVGLEKDRGQVKTLGRQPRTEHSMGLWSTGCCSRSPKIEDMDFRTLYLEWNNKLITSMPIMTHGPRTRISLGDEFVTAVTCRSIK